MWTRTGKLNSFRLVGLSLLLGVLPASAAEKAGGAGKAGVDAQPVYLVGYDTDFANGSLNVSLPTGVYYADVGVSSGCDLSVLSAETVRNWQSLAQSALLSGKTVSVAYLDCGGYHFIRWLGLNG